MFSLLFWKAVSCQLKLWWNSWKSGDWWLGWRWKVCRVWQELRLSTSLCSEYWRQNLFISVTLSFLWRHPQGKLHTSCQVGFKKSLFWTHSFPHLSLCALTLHPVTQSSPNITESKGCYRIQYHFRGQMFFIVFNIKTVKLRKQGAECVWVNIDPSLRLLPASMSPRLIYSIYRIPL